VCSDGSGRDTRGLIAELGPFFFTRGLGHGTGPSHRNLSMTSLELHLLLVLIMRILLRPCQCVCEHESIPAFSVRERKRVSCRSGTHRHADTQSALPAASIAVTRTLARQIRALVTQSRYAAPCSYGTSLPNESSSPSRCSARRQTCPRPAEHPSPSSSLWPAPTYRQLAFCVRF
jgi:hypothetical protein